MSIAAIGLACGCSQPAPPDNVPAVVATTAPQPRFVERDQIHRELPEPGSRHRVLEPIPCRIVLELSGGVKKPQIVRLELLRRGAIVSDCNLKLADREPDERGQIVLAGELKAPDRPGRYEVEVVAVDSVVIRDKPSDEGRIEHHYAKLPRISIEVTP